MALGYFIIKGLCTILSPFQNLLLVFDSFGHLFDPLCHVVGVNCPFKRSGIDQSSQLPTPPLIFLGFLLVS